MKFGLPQQHMTMGSLGYYLYQFPGNFLFFGQLNVISRQLHMLRHRVFLA